MLSIRNIVKKRIMQFVYICFGILFICTLVVSVLSLIKLQTNYFNIASLSFSILTFFITFNKSKSIKIVSPEQYQFDKHFVGREDEKKKLNILIENMFNSVSPENCPISCVSGSSGVGKTLFLRDFADNINHDPKAFIFTKASAYYVHLDNKESFLNNCAKQLGLTGGDVDTAQKLSLRLIQSAINPKVILIIDNLDTSSLREMHDFAIALLTDRKSLVIVLGVTATQGVNAEIVPQLFCQNELILLEKSYKQFLNEDIRSNIIELSNGLPAYVRFLYNSYVSKETLLLSNSEEISRYIESQIKRLNDQSKRLLAIVSFLKLIHDASIEQKALLGIAESGTEQDLMQLLDASLIVYKENETKVHIESIISEQCRKYLDTHRKWAFYRIYLFYYKNPKSSDIAAAALLLSDCTDYDEEWLMNTLSFQFYNNSYFYWRTLGNFDLQYWTNRYFTNNGKLYNEFRYYFLESLLQLGKYPDAYKAMGDYDNGFIPLPPITQCKTDIEFGMQFLIADLHHLCNRFTEAVDYAEILEKAASGTRQARCQYLRAHCMKHIGKNLFDADILLQSIIKNQQLEILDLRIKAIYSRIAIHTFWNDNNFDYLADFRKIEKIITKSTHPLASAQNVERHKAIYYLKICKDSNRALSILEDTLIILNKTQQRIKYDFYFEIAEVLRLKVNLNDMANNYDKAKRYYQRTEEFANEVGDYNLYSCALLGQLLMKYQQASSVYNTCDEIMHDITIVNEILAKTKEYELNINHSYAQFIKAFLLKERIPDTAIKYWRKMSYIDILNAANELNTNKTFSLKLTVM